MKCCWNRTMLNLCSILAAILKMATTRKCSMSQESIRDITIYPHKKCRWNRTMLNLCGIVSAILKMAIGRNFSMSGHHYIPTYQILMISDNVEILPPICYAMFWQPFWKWQASWKFGKHRIAPLMVTYHYVKFYVSIIIHLEVININVQNFNFPIGFYGNPHPLWTPQNMTLTPFTTKDQLETYIYNSTKFHEILSSSSWDLPWTSSCAMERKKGGE
jgi:hypothetical protein